MIVGVWLFPLDLPDAAIATLHDALDPVEQARAAQFRFDRDRRRFIARRGQLRRLLAKYLDRSPGELTFVANAFGKPTLRDGGSMTFNLSASGSIGLCVVARGIEVGCDIERRDVALADRAVADRLFAAGERNALAALSEEQWVDGFFAVWTRKEAFVKAVGCGLSYPLQDFEVSVGPEEPVMVVEPAYGWSLHAFVPLPGYVAAVAVPCAGVVRPPVRWFDAQEAFSATAASLSLPASGRSSGADRFGAESSISAALLSCAASSAVTPPTP